MEVGIIGLPLSGKTTIFNALTHSQAETARYSTGRYDMHTAVVDVPDPRVDILSRMFNPRKTTYAKIQFNDISGVAQGQGEGNGLDPQLLNTLNKCDAILYVVRAFQSDQMLPPEGAVDPARDLRALRFEMVIADLAIVERRIERIQVGLRKTRTADMPLLQQEQVLMERFREGLENETPIGNLQISAEEQALIRGFQFLTAKPAMVVVNLGEEDDPNIDLGWVGSHKRTSVIALRGAIEMEIAQLPGDEVGLFLESYGIAEPSLNMMVRECYNLLGLMSFFTVGEDEVRAWTVRRAAKAVEAAGAIHTDLARGFIRAEVLPYEDMLTYQTYAEARKQGKLRLEGKEYVVQDGDILNIRFNV